jgi:hypothetical protein
MKYLTTAAVPVLLMAFLLSILTTGTNAACEATFDMRSLDQVEHSYNEQTQTEVEVKKRMTVAYLELKADEDLYVDPSQIPSEYLGMIPNALKGRLFKLKEYFQIADANGASLLVSQILSMLVQIDVQGCWKDTAEAEGNGQQQQQQCDNNDQGSNGGSSRRRLSSKEMKNIFSKYHPNFPIL